MMNLEPLDGHGRSLLINITVERSGEMITMGLIEDLPSKSLWKASVLPYGCEFETDIVPTELSKL